MFLSELKLFSILIIFTLLPGIALIKLFFRHLSLDLFILLSVTLSLFVWTFLSSVGFIFAMPLATVITIWAGGVIISGLWILYQIFKHKTVKFLLPKVDFNFAVFLTFIILTALLVYWKGSFQDGDAWYHVAQAVNYLGQSGMVSESAFFSGYPAGTLYDFNAWHTFIAAISMIGRFQPNFVWINLSAFFFPVCIMAIYVFIKTTFQNLTFATTAVITMIVVNSIQGKFIFLTSTVIPGNLCLSFLMPLYFTIQFSENIKRKFLLLSLILGVIAFFHIYYFLVIIGYLIVFFLCDFFINHVNKSEFIKNIMKTTGHFLIGLPLLIAIYLYCLRHYSQTFPGTELPLIMLFGSWPIFSLTPDKLPFYLSVIVALFILIKSPDWRKNQVQLFILSNILIVPLLIYNPLILKLFSRLVPLNLIGRLKTPFFLLVPILWLFWKLFPKQIRLSRFQTTGYLSIVIIGGFVALLLIPENIKQRVSTYNKYQEPMGFHKFALQFQQNIPSKSVVIADSYTSYHLPVFADIDIVAMTAHSTPPLDLKTRIRDTNRFFNPLILSELKNTILQKYKIKYAAINSSILPWTQINNTDTLLTGNLYPDYIQKQNNLKVLQLPDSIKAGKLNFPQFIIYNDDISVFPAASITASDELFWQHAGMIFIKTKTPVAKISFHSRGGTHHVFYYSVIDKDHQIIEEEVFINDFSPRKIYRIIDLPADSWVIFSGNGISPLTILIN
mgnify:CR=1 FL=1